MCHKLGDTRVYEPRLRLVQSVDEPDIRLVYEPHIRFAVYEPHIRVVLHQQAPVVSANGPVECGRFRLSDLPALHYEKGCEDCGIF